MRNNKLWSDSVHMFLELLVNFLCCLSLHFSLNFSLDVCVHENIIYYRFQTFQSSCSMHRNLNYTTVLLRRWMEASITDPQAIEAISHPERAEEESQEQFKPPLKMKVICGYLYFIQGVIISLPGTMPLVYPSLPPYWVLSIFSAAVMPFSFKFLEAPFIEKFTKVSYGKRKTWIMISQVMASFMLFISSFFTSQNYQVVIAIFFLFTIFFITLQDISLDAMAIKELKIPYLAGMTQAIMQTVGLVLGGLIFLKLTSSEFSQSIGLAHPVTSPHLLLRVISLLILIPTIVLHFKYQETILESERTVSTKSLCHIIKYYKTFVNPKTRYCRFMIIFLLYLQGFNFFAAGYEFELVHAGFKRNTINTILNVVLIPVTILAIIISPRIEKFGWVKCLMIYQTSRWVLFAFLLATFPSSQHSPFISVPFISFVYFVIQALDTFLFILNSILINSFPVMGVSGMFITMLNSGSNFGNLKAPALAMIELWNWKGFSLVGLIIQAFLIAIYPRAYRFAMSAELGLPKDMDADRNDELNEEETNGKELEEVLSPQRMSDSSSKETEHQPYAKFMQEKKFDDYQMEEEPLSHSF